ncbi:935_t:CDS:1 [Ambispora leptoticha]|uniref:935_t:CDS:1 n=1 Tax=Ambispora leptoticha TaxID=144679 RepID=A0A9N8W7W2_9GLOM|nr:935_t:CDS:1 [Ambispora leptoticha]
MVRIPNSHNSYAEIIGFEKVKSLFLLLKTQFSGLKNCPILPNISMVLKKHCTNNGIKNSSQRVFNRLKRVKHIFKMMNGLQDIKFMYYNWPWALFEKKNNTTPILLSKYVNQNID